MASAAVQNKTPRKVLKKSTRDSLIAYSFIAPNFIGFCVFTLVPMMFAIALAFCAWDGRHAIEFIGLKNFVKLFTTDKIFQAALKNTIVYVIGTVPLTLACSLAMAVLLNQNVKLRNFFRTVAFFPYVASLVAVAAVWNMIFNPSMGPINMILNQFFGVAVENLPRWAAGKDTAMLTVILFSVWKNMALSMMALMRLCAEVMAWKSPVKCMLISSIGVRELCPPPVAPPLRPKTGPMEGWRSARQAFLPMAWSPCARPMDTVVFPSPEGVGVMADTRMSLAGVAVLSSTFKGILALLRPKGMTSFSSTPSLLTQSENAGMTMCV